MPVFAEAQTVMMENSVRICNRKEASFWSTRWKSIASQPQFQVSVFGPNSSLSHFRDSPYSSGSWLSAVLGCLSWWEAFARKGLPWLYSALWHPRVGTVWQEQCGAVGSGTVLGKHSLEEKGFDSNHVEALAVGAHMYLQNKHRQKCILSKISTPFEELAIRFFQDIYLMTSADL